MALFSWIKGALSSGAGYRKPGLQSGEAGSQPARAAASVNQDTALCLSAFWACVKLISESVASMPLDFFSLTDGIKTPQPNHPLQKLMNGKVNRYQTRFEFFETVTMNLAIHGNAYCLIQRNTTDQIIGLLPLMSAQMEVTLKEDNGDVLYKYNNGKGTRDFTSDKIWHVRLMGNGVIGLSPISYARNSIGIGLAAENRTSKIHANGAKPAGVLTIDHPLKADQRAKVKENFNELVNGNEDTLFVLEAGMKYQQVSMSPKDIELLESRRFQIEDVARFMGVPSVLINDTAATTVWGSGISQIVQGFYKLGLRPYLERYEASIIANLLKQNERGTISCEFDFNALLRADMAERFKTYKEAVTGAIMSPNEVRKIEGMVRKDGGDELFMQQQMTPIKLLAEGKGLKNEAQTSQVQ